ncbi:MAG: hypothetical protein AAFZ58_12300 [Pseudomonadota bacterium]
MRGRWHRKMLAFGLAVELIALPAAATDDDDTQAFFARFQELERTLNPDIADLYSDSAKVHGEFVYENGSFREFDWNGATYKFQLRLQATAAAQYQSDRGILYSNVRYERFEDGYRIYAERYEADSCFANKNWYLVVRPDSEGNLRIVEEFSLKWDGPSRCGWHD